MKESTAKVAKFLALTLAVTVEAGAIIGARMLIDNTVGTALEAALDSIDRHTKEEVVE